jgi:hypothetical protein
MTRSISGALNVPCSNTGVSASRSWQAVGDIAGNMAGARDSLDWELVARDRAAMILLIVLLLAQTIMRLGVLTIVSQRLLNLDCNHARSPISPGSRRDWLAPTLPWKHFMSGSTSPGGERFD